MDWFDDYLNALTDPGRNVVYPPDTNTWRPLLPNQQQKRMINDSMAFDLQQQMRVIQEAREQLERHGASRDAALGIGADPGSPTVQSVVYPEWNAGASYNVGDIVALNDTNYECTATAGAGFGPFGGFLDGTENGTVYWSAYPIVNTFAYQAYPPGGLVDDNNGNIPNDWVTGSNVTSVIFANNGSLTSIGQAAFKNNLLTSVILPNSVILIENDTFQNNTLSSVTIGNNVTNIGSDAFSNNSLTLITLPNALASIGSGAFIDNDLTSVIMGNNVTSIGNSAFKNNVITAITFSAVLNSIGDNAFQNNLLINVIIPNNVINLGSAAFQNNDLTAVTIGNSVQSIGNDAFASNELTSVVIPNSVGSIGESAFLDNNLITVTMGNNVISIGNNAFKDNAITAITFSAVLTSIGNNAFQNNALTNVIIPNSVNSLGSAAFQSNNLTAVTIGNNVTSIENNVFENNNTLATVLCYVALSAFTGSNAFYNTASPLTIRARTTDASWTAGTGLSFQGNANVTVIKNL